MSSEATGEDRYGEPDEKSGDGRVSHFGQVIGIKPEHLEEYEKAHRDVWPGVLKKIRESGIRNYSIFHHDDLLFAYFEYVGDDLQADMESLLVDPEVKRWWSWMMPMQSPLETRAEDEWWAEMVEVFHSD